MSYKLKTGQLAVKNPSTGEYENYDVLGEQTKTSLVNEIHEAGEEVIADVVAAGADAAVDAEAWATGGSGGVPSATNNAKYYAGQAEATLENFEIDDTLSIPGRAADAKAVGDMYRKLLPLSGAKWTSGVILATRGNESDDSTRIRTGVLDRSVRLMQIGSGYFCRVMAYDSDGAYRGCWNGSTFNTTANNLTGSVDFTTLPSEYHYRIVCGRTGDGAISTSEGLNILFSMEHFNPEYEADDEQRKYDAMTNGHIRYFNKLYGTPMDIYDDNGNVVRTVNGSDYIRIYTKEFVNCLLRVGGSISYPDSEFYLYVYDEGKHVAWDILDYTDPVSGEKNRFTEEALRALNGLQISNIPSGYYIRASLVNDCSLALAIWDGTRFGIPLSANAGVMQLDESGDLIKLDSDGNRVTTSGVASTAQKKNFSEDGRCTVVMPNWGDFAIAKPGYTFMNGYTGENIWQIPKSRFPTQVVPLKGIYGVNSGKNLELVKNYNYESGTFDRVCLAGDVSDYMVLLDFERTWSWEKPANTAHRTVRDKALQLCQNFKWTPVTDVWNSSGYKYTTGVEYNGVPYRSAWSTACYVGWHATKHTVMNAVNDPNSVFYYHSHRGNGAYYSLVCTSFATLVSGFTYPETNFGLVRDPNYEWFKSKQPVIGGLSTNGYGHAIVPLSVYSSDENETRKLFAFELTESGAPFCKNRVLFPGINTAWDGIGANSTYADNYNVIVYPKKHIGAATGTPYNIENYTVKNNATARPHKGDQSVYTSEGAVKINVYDNSANYLYYQEFNVTTKSGRITSSAAKGDVMFVCINPEYEDYDAGIAVAETEEPLNGVKGRVVTLRSSTSGGKFSGVDLTSGSVYAVWAGEDNTQTKAPTKIVTVDKKETEVLDTDAIEYFEWYDITKEQIVYSIEDGMLVTDDQFWYMVAMGYNNIDVYNPLKNKDGSYEYSAGLVSIPYEPPKRTSMIAGKDDLEGHSDYSKYRERYYIYSSTKEPVWAFFRKGKLGAYMMKGVKRVSWQNMAISSSSGALTETNKDITLCPVSFIASYLYSAVYPDEGYKIAVFAYTSAGTYLGTWNGTQWQKSAVTWSTDEINLADLSANTGLPAGHKFRMVVRRTDNNNITTDEGNEHIHFDRAEQEDDYEEEDDEN